MEDTLIAMGVAIILQSIRNPAKKASLKRVMLKLWKSIGMAYADDPDFDIFEVSDKGSV